MEKKKEETPERKKEEMAEGMDRTLKDLITKREKIEKEYDHILTQLNKLLTHYKAVADERRMGHPLKELQKFLKEVTKKRESPPPTPPAEEPEGIKAPPPFTLPPLPWLKRMVRDVLRRIAWLFIRWHYWELKAHISSVAWEIQQQLEIQSQRLEFQFQRLQHWEELSSLHYDVQKLEVKLFSDMVKVTQQIADTQRDYNEYMINLFLKLVTLVNTKDTETTYLVTKLPIERVDIILEEFSKKQEHLHQLIIKQSEELNRLLHSLGNEETK